MANWNKVEGTTNCGYKHDQYVLKSKQASAKVWSQYSGEVNYNFDTDDSPSISGSLQIPGLTKEQLVAFGKKIVTDVLMPKYIKVRKPSKKVARKSSPKKATPKKSSPKQSGNSARSLSVRASRQSRDSRGRFV